LPLVKASAIFEIIESVQMSTLIRIT